MWRKLLYSGFETCFWPHTQGAGTRTHLKSRFCAILTKRGALLELVIHWPSSHDLSTTIAGIARIPALVRNRSRCR